MVRRLNVRGGWMAGLLITIAAGGLLWHMLACVESPMSFSPDGKDLAFVTMEPYKIDDIPLAGSNAYRLMMLKGGKDLRVVELSVDTMLTSPAYRGDGQVFCYLRIPLLTFELASGLKQVQKMRLDLFNQATSRPADMEYPPGKDSPRSQPTPTSGPVTPNPVFDPIMVGNKALLSRAACGLELKATLVERNARTLEIVSTTPVSLFLLNTDTKGPDDYLWTYLMTRPQYSPDGKTVYFCAMGLVYAVTVPDGRFDILGGPAFVSSLCPDGSKIATLDEFEHPKVLSIIATDRHSIEYHGTDIGLLSSGFGWADNQSLTLLCSVKTDGDPNAHLVLRIMRTNGEAISTQGLPESPGKKDMLELARSFDGKHMVVSNQSSVLFLDAKGKQIGAWKAEEKSSDALAQPTFTPGGKLVAFKHMGKGETQGGRADAIVFFTPEGVQVGSVAIPEIKPGTTRPASMPATAAAQTAPAE